MAQAYEDWLKTLRGLKQYEDESRGSYWGFDSQDRSARRIGLDENQDFMGDLRRDYDSLLAPDVAGNPVWGQNIAGIAGQSRHAAGHDQNGITQDTTITRDGKRYVRTGVGLEGLTHPAIQRAMRENGVNANSITFDPQEGYLMEEGLYNRAIAEPMRKYNKDRSFGEFIRGPMLIASAMGASALAAGAMGGAAAGAGAGVGAADAAGLATMAADAGLTGAAADAFIASGGTLGSTAAGGGGVGLGALDSPWGVNQRPPMPDLRQTEQTFGDLYSVLNADDPIQAIGALDTYGGGVGSTAGAQAAGFGGVHNALNTILPGSLTAGGLVQSAIQGAGMGQGAGAGNLVDSAGNLGSGSGLLGSAGRVLGPLIQGGLGVIGANQQQDAFKEVSDKYFGMGQPYRDRLNASYQPGFSMENEPGYQGAMDQASKSVLRGLSTQGNPFDNPGVLSEAQKYVTNTTALPQLNTYRSQLGSFGQLGTNTAGTADMQGANASGGALNAIGYGLSNALAPKDDLTQLLNKSGFGLNTRGWGY